ncbi:MAG: glycosyltransferase 87 family protein, partial [Bdellovibrionia bacterium]
GLLLYLSYGRYGEPTIYFALAFGLFGSILFFGWKKLSKVGASFRIFEIGVWLLILIQLGCLCLSPALIYVRDSGASQALSSFLYLAICLWLVYGSRFVTRKSQRWVESPVIPILTVLFVVIAKALVISASPTPAIDGHIIVTQATDLFLDFKNPYTASYPEIYGGAYGYKPTFSYWPGTLYIMAPFRFFGLDMRYGLLFFDLIIGGLLGLLAFRKFSVAPVSLSSKKSISFSYSLLWVTLPVSFFVLEQAWLDTFIIAGGVGLLLCLFQDRFKTASLIAGFMVTVKQYAAFYVLFAIFEFFSRAREIRLSLKGIFSLIGVGFLSFSLFMLPFVLVNPRAFYEATIEFFSKPIPMRLDALTLRAWVALRTGVDTLEIFSNPVVLAVVLVGLSVWCMAQLRSKKSPRGMTYAVSSYVLFSCMFLFGTHSFCNQYYFLAIWPLLISLI